MPAEIKPRVRIVNTSGIGRNTKIYIDDVDVSHAFSSVTIRANVNSAVQAELVTALADVEIEGDAHPGL